MNEVKIELWLDIKNYERIYQISNTGRVKSLTRTVLYRNGERHTHRGKILEAKQDTQEYRGAILSKNGKIKRIKISRLVAIHFIPNPMNYKIVNHIDGNKKNDFVGNLEWCTQSHNNIHAFQLGLKSFNRKKHTQTIGVSFNRGKYDAFVYRNNRNTYIGRFATEMTAQRKIKEYKDVNHIAN